MLLDVTFDNNGDLDRESFLVKVVNGKQVGPETLPPAASSPGATDGERPRGAGRGFVSALAGTPGGSPWAISSSSSCPGTATGAIYALAALGFTLLWQAAGVINFAQGEFVMLPAFAMLFFIAAARRCGSRSC